MSIVLEKVDLGKIKYLIYSNENKENIDGEFNKGIIDKDVIPGALPAFLTVEEDKIKIRYHVTDESALSEILKDTIGKSELKYILKVLIDVFLSAEEKNINIKNYLLDKDYVFIDKSNKEIYLIYIPLKDAKEETTVITFIKDIISTIKYDLNEDLYFFVQLHNYLNNEGFTLEGLYKLIDDEPLESVEERKAEKIEEIQEDELDFEEEGTTILNEFEEEGTTILGLEEYYGKMATVERVVSGEAVEIYKTEFKIGRDRNTCDFFVDNKSVGRLHAVITKRNEQYYLLDNSSRNGTYLNDKRLNSMREYMIKNGDEIRLSNETLIFKLY